MGGNKADGGGCLLCPRHGNHSRRYVDGNRLCASVKVISADKFLRTDLRREKFLFTEPSFSHQDDDPTKPPTIAEVEDVQPVDGLGNVLPHLWLKCDCARASISGRSRLGYIEQSSYPLRQLR